MQQTKLANGINAIKAAPDDVTSEVREHGANLIVRDSAGSFRSLLPRIAAGSIKAVCWRTPPPDSRSSPAPWLAAGGQAGRAREYRPTRPLAHPVPVPPTPPGPRPRPQ